MQHDVRNPQALAAGRFNRVYVVNSGYECVGRCKLHRAWSLINQGKAEVVKASDQVARSVETSFNIPTIIRVFKYIPLYSRRIKFSNRMVWERDGYTCRYCGVKIETKGDLTTDHVRPRSKGGRTCYENMVTACSDCNSKKSNKSLDQMNWHILGELPLKAPTISAAMKKVNDEVSVLIQEEWANMRTVA